MLSTRRPPPLFQLSRRAWVFHQQVSRCSNPARHPVRYWSAWLPSAIHTATRIGLGTSACVFLVATRTTRCSHGSPALHHQSHVNDQSSIMIPTSAMRFAVSSAIHPQLAQVQAMDTPTAPPARVLAAFASRPPTNCTSRRPQQVVGAARTPTLPSLPDRCRGADSTAKERMLPSKMQTTLTTVLIKRDSRSKTVS